MQVRVGTELGRLFVWDSSCRLVPDMCLKPKCGNKRVKNSGKVTTGVYSCQILHYRYWIKIGFKSKTPG